MNTAPETRTETRTQPLADESEFEPFSGNQIAATFDARPTDEDLGRLDMVIDECAIEVLDGPAGRAALVPNGLFEQLQAALDERRRPRSVLTDVLDDGGVVVRAHYHDDVEVDPLIDALIALGAGWVYRFDRLTWSEVHTPSTAVS